MRMSDWSSDVCSSDLLPFLIGFGAPGGLQDREAGGNQIRAIDDFLAALVGGLLRTPGDPHHVAYAGLLRQFGLSAETGHAIPARIFLPFIVDLAIIIGGTFDISDLFIGVSAANLAVDVKLRDIHWHGSSFSC